MGEGHQACIPSPHTLSNFRPAPCRRRAPTPIPRRRRRVIVTTCSAACHKKYGGEIARKSGRVDECTGMPPPCTSQACAPRRTGSTTSSDGRQQKALALLEPQLAPAGVRLFEAVYRAAGHSLGQHRRREGQRKQPQRRGSICRHALWGRRGQPTRTAGGGSGQHGGAARVIHKANRPVATPVLGGVAGACCQLRPRAAGAEPRRDAASDRSRHAQHGCIAGRRS